jgi:hypothetical protein
VGAVVGAVVGALVAGMSVPPGLGAVVGGVVVVDAPSGVRLVPHPVAATAIAASTAIVATAPLRRIAIPLSSIRFRQS